MTTDRVASSPADPPSLTMLPGLDGGVTVTHDLEDAVLVTLDARRSAGLITDLDAAVGALAQTTARKLDLSVGVGRASGRAKLLMSMSDILEQLPAPEAPASDLHRRYIAAVTGQPIEDETKDESLPPRKPPADTDGPQAAGVIATLRARHDAGLSTRTYAAHEQLALTAATDLDLAIDLPGRPSGYAELSSTMARILERLPRPAGADDGALLEQLLATVPEQPSPFTALPPAKHHPDRDPDWLTEGHEIAAVARAMGRHLMPWQRRALDVATEYKLDPFGRRIYRYTTVTIIVPRQSGKTDLTIPMQVHRILTRREPISAWYTAQSGQDARRRMMDLILRVEESKLGSLVKSSRSNGSEGLAVRAIAGSHLTKFAPTLSALHGEHPHLVTLDEIWKLSTELGHAILGAAEPAQITLGGQAQIWQISTMGTASSDFINEQVSEGRAGTDPSICYIEYSIPDGLDPFDPDSWPKFHPALGNTIQLEDLAVRARRAQGHPERTATFLRAYCNIVVASDGSLVDMAAWDDLAVVVDAPDTSQLVLGYEVAPGGTVAAIVAAWTDAATGRPAVRIVRQQPGTSWLVSAIADLADRWQCPVLADGAGPSGRHTTALIDAGVEVRTLTMPEYGQATEALLAAAGSDATLIHDGSDELREQMAAAQVRTSNGVRRWHRDSPRPIPALIAASVALYGVDHPAEAPVGSIVL